MLLHRPLTSPRSSRRPSRSKRAKRLSNGTRRSPLALWENSGSLRRRGRRALGLERGERERLRQRSGSRTRGARRSRGRCWRVSREETTSSLRDRLVSLPLRDERGADASCRGWEVVLVDGDHAAPHFVGAPVPGHRHDWDCGAAGQRNDATFLGWSRIGGQVRLGAVRQDDVRLSFVAVARSCLRLLVERTGNNNARCGSKPRSSSLTRSR